MKLRKKISLIDQHDKFGMWGGKFGGNFVPETLKKPISELEILFNKLRNNKIFLMREINILKNGLVHQQDLLNYIIFQINWRSTNLVKSSFRCKWWCS